MAIPPENQMMLILISEKNPLWAYFMNRGERTIANINHVINISHGTATNWRKGRNIDRVKAGDVFKSILEKADDRLKDHSEYNEIKEKIKTLRDIYFDGEISISSISNILDIPAGECQRIVDEAYFNLLPVFPEMYYDNSASGRSLAEQDLKMYGGLYHLFARRDTRWYKCSLSVLSVLRICDGLTIRCSLAIPNIETADKKDCWSYEGFLIIRARQYNLFWNFEKKEKFRGDYFHFITDLGASYQGKWSMCGTYLTTGQGDKRSIIVTDDVLLQRISTDVDARAVEQAMVNDVDVISDESECSRIDGFLQMCRRPVFSAPQAAS
jgi:hypothetical protein